MSAPIDYVAEAEHALNIGQPETAKGYAILALVDVFKARDKVFDTSGLNSGMKIDPEQFFKGVQQ